MSLPAALSDRTLATLTAALDLRVTSTLALTSPMSPTPIGHLHTLHPVDGTDLLDASTPLHGTDPLSPSTSLSGHPPGGPTRRDPSSGDVTPRDPTRGGLIPEGLPEGGRQEEGDAGRRAPGRRDGGRGSSAPLGGEVMTSGGEAVPSGGEVVRGGAEGLARGRGVVAKVVTVSLVVPPIGLDSHMIFAFTHPQSPVPHFTLDSVASADYHAMHLDLIPRTELATHLDYLDTCFLPLTDLLESAWKIDGLSPAAVSPRQRAMMSPWMLVCRATQEAFQQLTPTVDAYLDHWLALVGKGVPPVQGDLAERDTINRRNLFSKDVDPVWHQVTRLLGDEQAERVRGELLT